MELFFCLLGLSWALESVTVVEYFNSEYSKISGNERELFSLVKEIEWDGVQGLLLLNNTYRGMNLHQVEVEKGESGVVIKGHVIGKKERDINGIGYIQSALLDYLKTGEVRVESMDVFRVNFNEVVLYSSDVEMGESKYFVDVLKMNGSNLEYVYEVKVLSVPKTVVKESLRITGISVAGILGFLIGYVGLGFYFRRFGGLPFVIKQDIRVFNDEKVT